MERQLLSGPDVRRGVAERPALGRERPLPAWPVVCGRNPVRHGSMTNIHKLSGTVGFGGFQYEWELRSEPHWSEFDGWRGMTVALLRKYTQRGALLEFPPPIRLLKGMQRGRLQISDAIVIRGIQAALDAGWEPASRGKPMVFVVDADGN